MQLSLVLLVPALIACAQVTARAETVTFDCSESANAKPVILIINLSAKTAAVPSSNYLGTNVVASGKVISWITKTHFAYYEFTLDRTDGYFAIRWHITNRNSGDFGLYKTLTARCYVIPNHPERSPMQ